MYKNFKQQGKYYFKQLKKTKGKDPITVFKMFYRKIIAKPNLLTFTFIGGLLIVLTSAFIAMDINKSYSAPFIFRADLELDKTVDKVETCIDDNVRFTVTLKNKGPFGTNNVEVKDKLPNGYTYVTHFTSKGTYNKNNGKWKMGNLHAYQAVSLVIVGKVKANGNHINVAEVTKSSKKDPDSKPNNHIPSEDDQDSASVTPSKWDKSDLKVSGVCDQASGEVVFTITNAGKKMNKNTKYRIYRGGVLVQTHNIKLNKNQSKEVKVKGLCNDIRIEVNQRPCHPGPSQVEAQVKGCGCLSADLELTKTVDNETPCPGDQVKFTISLKNNGPNATGIVRVLDSLPTGYNLTSYSVTKGWYHSIGDKKWRIPFLHNGEEVFLYLWATVNPAGDYDNVAEVTFSLIPDPDSTPNNHDPAEDDQDNALVALCSPAIAIDKTGPTEAYVGDLVTYTYNVTNDNVAGDGTPVSSVFVNDDIAGAAIYQSGDDGDGKLEVGETWVYTAAYTVQLADPDPLGNIGTAIGNNGVGNPVVPATDSHSLDILSVADLSLTKDVDNSTPYVGDTVTFTMNVQNDGPSTANNILISDIIPGGYSYVGSSMSGGDSQDDSGTPTLNWTINGLASGSNVNLTFQASVNPVGDYTNGAEVMASDEYDPDSIPGDSTGDDYDTESTTPIPVADLYLEKVVSETTPYIGDNITFTVTASNDGPSGATGVVVTDILPSGYTYISDDSGGNYDLGTGLWDVGVLDSGISDTLEITVNVNGSEDYINVAEITAADQYDPDSTPNNNDINEDDQDEATTEPIIPEYNVSIIKSADPAHGTVLFPNDLVTYFINYENVSNKEINNVVITDTLENSVDYISNLELNSISLTDQAGDDQGEYDDSARKITVNVGNLAIGESGVVSFKVEVRPEEYSKPGLRDQAYINCDEIDDKASNIVIHPVDPIEIEKLSEDINGGELLPGDEILWKILVRNTGYIETSEVVITDVIPENTAYVAGSIAGRGANDNNEPNLIWNVESLQVDEEIEVSFITTVNENVAGGTIIRNLAVAESGQGQDEAESTQEVGFVEEIEEEVQAEEAEEIASVVDGETAEEKITELPATGKDDYLILLLAAIGLVMGGVLIMLARNRKSKK